MGSFSLSHWLIVLVVVLVMFGAGRIPAAMGDLARGIRAFRTGMRDDHAAKSRSGQLVECAACRSARGLKRPLRAAAGSSVTH